MSIARIKATYEDGILHVSLLKPDDVKPKSSMEIKISQGVIITEKENFCCEDELPFQAV